jgi:hypothetical protein
MMVARGNPEELPWVPHPLLLSHPTVPDHREKRKIRFTKEQDDLIQQLASQEPKLTWAEIASQVPRKSAKQCRERYQHFLAPDLQRDPWTLIDDARLIQWRHFYGTDWASIARYFPGRTNNDVKNRYNGHLKGEETKIFLAVMAARIS